MPFRLGKHIFPTRKRYIPDSERYAFQIGDVSVWFSVGIRSNAYLMNFSVVSVPSCLLNTCRRGGTIGIRQGGAAGQQ